MPTLLVIDRDDAYLPRGWVSAVLPDHVAPTDYERSGRLWKLVTVPAGSELEKIKASASPRLASRSMRYALGGVTLEESPVAAIRERLSLPIKVAPVPGPERLDRSHSTVWDYGPGRTYSSPQAAFDALLAQAGSAGFTETHYVRGFGATFGQGPSGNVLNLHTVTPSSRYPLVIDVEDGHAVTFDDENGAIALFGEGVDHVRVSGLRLIRGVFGVAPASETETSRDWLIEDCECDGSVGSMWVGVAVVNSDDLRVVKCRLTVPSGWGVGSFPGLPDDYVTRVLVRGCKIDANSCAIGTNAEVTYLLANNTFRANDYGIRHEGVLPLILAVMINNVFLPAGEAMDCISALNLDPDGVRLIHSDGNCFHPGTGNVADLAGLTLTLAQWQERFGHDHGSIDSDPALDEDLDPMPGSPCLGAGVSLDDQGWSGKQRAASVDMGAEQTTLPRAPGVQARLAAEIRRRS